MQRSNRHRRVAADGRSPEDRLLPTPTLAYREAMAEALGDRAPRSRVGPADAFRAAQRRYMAGQRLDMRALARELGVSRATLYRWAGEREHLLGDVIWARAAEIHRDSMRAASGRGATRILDVITRAMATIARAAELRSFLEADPEVALRVLTTRDGRVQGRLVAAVTELIREEVRRGGYEPAVDPAVLGYAIVRIGEASLYNDAIVALEPDLDATRAIFALLVR